MLGPAHVPVMAVRVIDRLVVDPSGRYWDATVGAAGHARMIVERLTEGGKLFGSDRDPKALELAAAALAGHPITLATTKFSDLLETWQRLKVGKLNGLLFDYGIGSFQLDDPVRGISFELDGPLDMRLGGTETPVSAWLNAARETEIADVIHRYGEERAARRIARAIVARRPLVRTAELREAVESAVPARFRTKSLARVFQAFRILTNNELDEIRDGLKAARDMLVAGGRIVTLTYHSLEDRIVKHFFRQESTDCICPPDIPQCVCGHRAWLKVVTRRAEVPDPQEVEVNSRARSAKLRVAERL